jgi:hypothetical protein
VVLLACSPVPALSPSRSSYPHAKTHQRTFSVSYLSRIMNCIEHRTFLHVACRCEKCNGIGLVKNSKGTALLKCSECGGFFPWLGWKTFFTSTASPANGGPLMQPKGQTSVFYTVPAPRNSKPTVPSSTTANQATAEPDASTEASGRGSVAVKEGKV